MERRITCCKGVWNFSGLRRFWEILDSPLVFGLLEIRMFYSFFYACVWEVLQIGRWQTSHLSNRPLITIVNAKGKSPRYITIKGSSRIPWLWMKGLWISSNSPRPCDRGWAHEGVTWRLLSTTCQRVIPSLVLKGKYFMINFIQYQERQLIHHDQGMKKTFLFQL
jgi:hypothetical protein